jgi:xanthine dehydrogenase YagS FAD-binding subunit
MHPFSLQKPDDIDAAVSAVSDQNGARFLAGGTTLVDLMKLNIERPEVLVDITSLPGLDLTARDADGNLRIGALAKMSDVADNALVRNSWPVVAQALEKGASAQLRNMATIGGNLMQRTRCPYFRDVATRCNKRKPQSGCDARDGINRENALLGTSDQCIALHPSDLCVALVALDTVVETIGPQGRRMIPLESLYREPGDEPHIEHDLLPGELILAVTVKRSVAARRSAYLKIRDRESYQFAVVSVAAALDLEEDGTIREARIGLGGVATTPWRARNVESYLLGRQLDESTIMEAGRIAMAEAQPRQFNAFKIPLVKGAIAQVLLSLPAIQ